MRKSRLAAALKPKVLATVFDTEGYQIRLDTDFGRGALRKSRSDRAQYGTLYNNVSPLISSTSVRL